METDDRINLKIWRWQRGSAMILFPLLLFHVIYTYFVVGMDEISMDSVSTRVQFAGYLILDIVLLCVVVVHAFAGIRSIYIDYQSDRRKVRSITWVIGLLGAGVVAYAVVALSVFI